MLFLEQLANGLCSTTADSLFSAASFMYMPGSLKISETGTLEASAPLPALQASKRVQLENTGDVGAKFAFDMKALAPHFSVFPGDGFLAPGQDVKLEVTFHPRSINADIRMERVRVWNSHVCPGLAQVQDVEVSGQTEWWAALLLQLLGNCWADEVGRKGSRCHPQSLEADFQVDTQLSVLHIAGGEHNTGRHADAKWRAAHCSTAVPGATCRRTSCQLALQGRCAASEGHQQRFLMLTGACRTSTPVLCLLPRTCVH